MGMQRTEYDYVVVGGGSAGCALAARLSEQADVSVLLLEAGPPDTSPFIHVPAGYFVMNPAKVDWGFRTVPQAHAGMREMPYTQGRVLGGGGSINAQVFTRGTPRDYDRWAFTEGCTGWSFEEIRHCFVRMEDNDTLAGPFHGKGGPLGVSTTAPNLLTRVFVEACVEAGIPATADFNGARQEGAGVYQTTSRNGRRCSAAAGYLAPARRRPNLTVATNCRARRVVVENRRAVAVEYEQNRQLHEARAAGEVILAAGGIGSPRLLLLSGIGPADDLQEVGIPVVHDLPGVGQNLHDHYTIDLTYELSGAYGLDRYRRRHWKAIAALQYLLLRSGPAVSNIVEGGAFLRVDSAAHAPDVQLHFVAGAGVPPEFPPLPSPNGCMINAYVLRPQSRGTLRLCGANPDLAPAIDPNFLAAPEDMRLTLAAVERMRDIMRQPAFRPFLKREHLPGPDAPLDAYVRAAGRTGYHPTGACRMGVDAMAVVDPQLRVRGLAGLRVCDSSVMPSLVSSNTNAPTMMIAERAAEFLLGTAEIAPARPRRIAA